MSYAYIRPIDPAGIMFFAEVIAIGPGSPPPRPRPLPPLPGGPVDPGYSPPWAQVPGPGDPHPSHPIALPGDPWWGGGGPVDPGYSPPWAQVPGGGGPGTPTPGPAGGVNAVVLPMPPQDPPAAPPAGMPAGSSQMLVWFGPGTKPAMAWVGPYASTGPVTPPTTPPAPEAAKK